MNKCLTPSVPEYLHESAKHRRNVAIFSTLGILEETCFYYECVIPLRIFKLAGEFFTPKRSDQ